MPLSAETDDALTMESAESFCLSRNMILRSTFFCAAARSSSVGAVHGAGSDSEGGVNVCAVAPESASVAKARLRSIFDGVENGVENEALSPLKT